MSNSLPRTMRRNAAMIGSTSRKSNSKVFALTVPSLSAWLLPCVRVTVISLGPAMAGALLLGTRDDRFVVCSPDGAISASRRVFNALWRNPRHPFPHFAIARRKTRVNALKAPCGLRVQPSAALEAALLVHD